VWQTRPGGVDWVAPAAAAEARMLSMGHCQGSTRITRRRHSRQSFETWSTALSWAALLYP